jgi:hypothetical protein
VTVQLLHRGDCQLRLDALEPVPLPSELEARVAGVWSAEVRDRPGLFNGRMLTALGYDDGLVRAGFTEYRRFVAQRRDRALRAALGVQPIAVSGLVETADGEVMLGRRGDGVTQYPGCWESVPSGTLDERALAGGTPVAGSVLDPAPCLLAELEEESGIAAADVAQVVMIGLFLDAAEDTLDVAYFVRLSLDAEQVRKRVAARADRGEYAEIATLGAAAAGTYLERSGVVPTSRALLQAVYGRE